MTVRELVTVIGFKVKDSDVKDADKKTKALSKRMKAGFIGVIVGIGAIATAAISAAADMEMLTTQFEVMLGSTEAATEMMDELKKFSAETPFALNDLAQGSQNLLAFGVQSKDVIETMRMLGDASGGNAEKLQGLVAAYGKVTVRGKASMEELLMIAERGVPIFEVLSTQLGVSQEQLFKMVSRGEVGAANVTEAFNAMTSSGGIFFEGMAKQSQTFHGLVSTMKDNFNLLLADIGVGLMPVMKEVVGVITELTKGPLKELIGALLQSFIPVLSIIKDLIAPLAEALIPVFQALAKVFEPIIAVVGDILVPILEALTPLLELISMGFELIGWVFEIIGPIISTVFGGIIDAVGSVIQWVVDTVKSVLDFFGLGDEDEGDDLENITIDTEQQTLAQDLSRSTIQSSRVTNVNMTNNIGISGGDGTGSRGDMDRAARSAFTLELKKVLISSQV